MKEYRIEISATKTKLMVGTRKLRILVYRRKKQVEKYSYLGIVLTKEWISEKEVRQSITMVKETFKKKKRLFYGKLDLDFQMESVECCVACLTVWINFVDTEKIGKNKMGRKTEKWQGSRKSERRKWFSTDHSRKATYLGAIFRGSGPVTTILEETVEVKIEEKRENEYDGLL